MPGCWCCSWLFATRESSSTLRSRLWYRSGRLRMPLWRAQLLPCQPWDAKLAVRPAWPSVIYALRTPRRGLRWYKKVASPQHCCNYIRDYLLAIGWTLSVAQAHTKNAITAHFQMNCLVQWMVLCVFKGLLYFLHEYPALHSDQGFCLESTNGLPPAFCHSLGFVCSLEHSVDTRWLDVNGIEALHQGHTHSVSVLYPIMYAVQSWD